MYFLKSKQDQNSMELSKRVIGLFKKNKISFYLDQNLKLQGNKRNIKDINPKVIIEVGDYNFILNTFSEIGEKQVPLLGIASSQSFLAQCDTTNFDDCIKLL